MPGAVLVFRARILIDRTSLPIRGIGSAGLFEIVH